MRSIVTKRLRRTALALAHDVGGLMPKDGTTRVYELKRPDDPMDMVYGRRVTFTWAWVPGSPRRIYKQLKRMHHA